MIQAQADKERRKKFNQTLIIIFNFEHTNPIDFENENTSDNTVARFFKHYGTTGIQADA